MKFKLFGIIWDFTNLILNIYVFVNPRFWINVGDFDKEWDRMVREELKDPHFEYASKHTVKLNGRKIWISNYPYGFGCDYSGIHYNILPSRKTRFLLNAAMNNKKNYIKKGGGKVVQFK